MTYHALTFEPAPAPSHIKLKIDRLKKSCASMSVQQIIDAHAYAQRSAVDAHTFLSAEIAYYGEASPDTEADCEYYDEEAHAWSIIAAQLGITTLTTTPSLPL